MSKQDYTTLLR